MTWDSLIAPRWVAEALYDISEQIGTMPPGIQVVYMGWLKERLADYALTDDDCLHLLHGFAPAMDAAKGGES